MPSICVGHLHPRVRPVARKHLPLSLLGNWWSNESFYLCPRTTLDAADHGEKQPERFTMGKLDNREEYPRQDSVMWRRWNDTLLQPD